MQSPTATHGKKSPQKPANIQATTISQLVAALPCNSHAARTFPASLGAPQPSLHDGDHCRPNVRCLTSLSGRKANKNYIGGCTWMWRSFLYQPQERGTSTDVVAVAGAPRHFRVSAKKIRRLVRAGALIQYIATISAWRNRCWARPDVACLVAFVECRIHTTNKRPTHCVQFANTTKAFILDEKVRFD